MEYAGIILQGLGAVTSVVGAFNQAGREDEAAKSELVAGAENARAERRRGAQIVAKQKAAAGAAGADINIGTPLELALVSAAEAERNAQHALITGRGRFHQRRAEAQGTRARGIGSAIGGLGSILSSEQGQGLLAKGQSVLSEFFDT